MIINPLTNSYNLQEKGEMYNDDKKIINNVIEYILEKHSNTLVEMSLQDKNKNIIENIIKEKIININSNCDVESILKSVMDRFFGYYILQKYIDDEDISDVRVINYNTIYIKEKGMWKRTNECFNNEKEYLNFVRYCILKNNGKINNEVPIVVVSDKKNNLRIEAGIDPVNVISPNLVIRIHRPNNYKILEDLCSTDINMFNSEICFFLVKAMIAGVNIIISGKGASGKTTLLRALINKIPQNIAITSNEETAELFCNHPNLIQREIIQNRSEEKNITLEKLTKQCLLMSNDCIIVGELKGAECVMFLDAIATGHRGYATVHSNSSKNTINRLITLMKRDKNTSAYSPNYLEQILCSSVDIVIYMQNFKIKEITEISYDLDNERAVFNPLFEFKINEIIDNVLKGNFQKLNEPKFIVKEKMNLYNYEISRIMEEKNDN